MSSADCKWEWFRLPENMRQRIYHLYIHSVNNAKSRSDFIQGLNSNLTVDDVVTWLQIKEVECRLDREVAND